MASLFATHSASRGNLWMAHGSRKRAGTAHPASSGNTLCRICHSRPDEGVLGLAGREREEIPMAGELTFFEIGVEDAQRGRRFYEALFGWTFEPGPSGGGGFGITAPNLAGGMHGGDKGAAPYVFFGVD